MSSDSINTAPEELKYLTVGEIREEIALAVGGDTERYGRRGYTSLHLADLRRIAKALQPEEDETDVDSKTRRGVFDAIVEWADIEYDETCVGRQNRSPHITRDILKQIHKAIGSSSG